MRGAVLDIIRMQKSDVRDTLHTQREHVVETNPEHSSYSHKTSSTFRIILHSEENSGRKRDTEATHRELKNSTVIQLMI